MISSLDRMVIMMSRSATEKQASAATKGAEDTDAELTKAVDFATLISMSSLGAPEIQNDRLTGRREIVARLEEQAEVFGVETPLPTSTPATDNLDVSFECRVADLLELRGYTFEAEVRYRRLCEHPASAHRLALLLEAKGLHRESWQWYLQSACSNDPNSLFRLAAICWSRGDRDRATRLVNHALAQLPRDARATLTTSIDNLGNRMSVKSALNSKMDVNVVYALGSVLLALANRPDLGRLAYCSAAIRGFSLAAVTLLDLTRALIVQKADNRHLDDTLRDELDGDLQIYSPTQDQCSNFDRSLLLLKNDVQNEKFEDLAQVIRTSKDSSDGAIDRILFTTRLITLLHGYGQLGCNKGAAQYIDTTADIVCGKVHHKLVKNKACDMPSLINMIHDWSARGINNYKQPKQNSSQHKKKYKLDEHEKMMAMSGIVGRMRREYLHLPPEHREVLILRLAGLCSGEVANALSHREADIDQILTEAVTRLREAQEGNQMPTGKLLEAGADKLLFHDILS